MNSLLSVVFPGQGSQYAAMGKKLLESFPDSKHIFNEASEYISYNLLDDCISASDHTLTQSKYLQASVFVISYAYFKAFQQEYGIEPACATGHSLGEISALACSGAITFKDAVRMVVFRGEVMSEASKQHCGGMSAITNVHTREVEKACNELKKQGEDIYCATYNLPDQTVISGSVAGLQKAEVFLAAKGAKTKGLFVMGAFHSPFMRSAIEPYAEYMSSLPITKTYWPVFSTRTSYPYIAPFAVNSILVEQLTSPVYWFQTIENMYQCAVRIFVEVGPGHVLKNLIKRQYPNCRVYTIEESQDRKALHTYFCNKNIPNGHVYKAPISTMLSEMLRIAVSMPYKGKQENNYEKTVAEPYGQLLQMQQAQEAGKIFERKDYGLAIKLFKGILDAKQVTKQKQESLLQGLFDYAGMILDDQIVDATNY